ncbi:MAG: glycoside hydrolase family 3 protein [Hyphomonas sp.]|nr:glycoside hydrolase family 3 protein [Hyphomonas sp.]MCB9971115.1 glycoside hydrolase family 3 protein [Hyphomonas sp.]
MTRRVISAGAAILGIILSACASTQATKHQNPQVVSVWPDRSASAVLDPTVESRIDVILSSMSLEQKIGQMTQADIRYISPDEVRQYYVGSILNGGGAWPSMRKDATVADWAELAEAYYDASMSSDAAYPVPVIWGTDAVHGHNNVAFATIFPHNIGLGAADDPDLTYRIGRATARALRATGITWDFAPTLAVAQDRRWGRYYESYSSDPTIVARNGAALVRGLQGHLDEDGDVLATAKHYLGDGGTDNGKDQGTATVSVKDLAKVHGAGYLASLDAGVATVMGSYSSWTDAITHEAHGKMHGNRELLTSVLKERLGFTGVVVSDWNAIEQLPGCARDRCPQAVNAGIDLFMVPEDWKAFIANTLDDVREGRIPESRIDDAVRRILRVKLASGLFDHPPKESQYFADASAVRAPDLAREAVRKSAVLLKNDSQLLPLPRSSRVLLVGEAADTMAMQMGGWTLTWQGDENPNSDFKTGETLRQALQAVLGTTSITYSKDGSVDDPSGYDVIVAVLGENPYAEYNGDVAFPQPLSYSASHPADATMLANLAATGLPVVTVLYSGRTLYASDLINRSQAFVAAFLPGSEAGGLADLIVAAPPGEAQSDFTGHLPFAWPATPCATSDTDREMLFRRGYGLAYAEASDIGPVTESVTPVACD